MEISRTRAAPRTIAVLAVLGAIAGCVTSCADAGGTRAPRTVMIDAVPREAPPRHERDASTLVWARDREGKAWTFHLQSNGAISARVEGIRVATATGDWTWTTRVLTVETEPCDFASGHAEPAQGGAATRASLVSADDREQVIVAPRTGCDGERCANELRHDVGVLASLGPYLFIEQSRYVYACGAHGTTEVSFLVWDAERGRGVDVTRTLPRADALRAEAAKQFASAADDVGGSMTDDPPHVTELLPVLDGRHLAFEAQLTTAACYACSDGRWSSYTRSIRLRVDPPPLLSAHADVPAPVAAFAARHPDLAIGGWSAARSPVGPAAVAGGAQP